MANKMTKKDFFCEILNKYPLTDDERNFINHEIELLERKNSAEKKPTAKQNENAGIKDAILKQMDADRYYTITEMIAELPACKDMQNQRVSALLKQMYDCENPVVERVYDKRKALFHKIAQ